MDSFSKQFRGLAYGVIIGATPPAQAQTDPVGFKMLAIQGDGYTLLGEQLLLPTLAAGEIDSSSGNQVTDAAVDFGALLTAADRAVLEVPPSVIDVLSFSGNTLTLAEAVPAGAIYRLRKLRKLDEIFKPDLMPEFNAAEDFNPDTGDLFLIADGQGGYRQYFYSVQPGLTGFFNVATGEAENPFLRYTDALLVLRQGASYWTVITGEVKTTDSAVPLFRQIQPVGVVNPLPTLDSLNLAATLQAGTPDSADFVWSQDETSGNLHRYFYSNGTGPGLSTGWRRLDPAPGAENAEMGATEVSPGVIIRRRGSLPHTVVMKAPLIFP